MSKDRVPIDMVSLVAFNDLSAFLQRFLLTQMLIANRANMGDRIDRVTDGLILFIH